MVASRISYPVFNTDTSYVVKDTAVIRFSYLSPDAEGDFREI